MQEEIVLQEKALLAQGNDRNVYRHPHNKQLLVKVVRHEIAKYRSKCREMRRELKECIPLTAEDSARIQTIYGVINTNLGLGEVVYKERDQQGNLAATLYDIILSGQLDRQKMYRLQQFFDWFVHTEVIIHSLHCKNIVYAWDDQQQKYLFKIIDGFGDKTWFQLSKFLPHIRAWNKIKCLKRIFRHLNQQIKVVAK